MRTRTGTDSNKKTITDRMQQLSARVLVGAFCVLGLTVFIAVVGLTVLVYRGPRSGPSLQLVSETSLPPAPSLLSGTDYATVRQGVLYLAYSSTDALLTIDTKTNVIRTFASHLDGLHGVAFSENPALAFVSVGAANEVSVLAMPSGATRKSVSTGADPDGIVFDQRAGMAYVGNGKGNSATLIPARNRDASFTLALGGSPEYPQVDETTGLIYQPLVDGSEVVVIDPMARSILHRFAIAPCEGPTGSAIDSAAQVLFIGCSNRLLAVMDLRDGHIDATLPIGRFVDVVAWDPGLRRIYTANSAGSMTVIERDQEGHYAVLDTVRTRAGGHTLAVDPTTHRVYVVCSGLRRASVIAYDPVLPSPFTTSLSESFLSLHSIASGPHDRLSPSPHNRSSKDIL